MDRPGTTGAFLKATDIADGFEEGSYKTTEWGDIMDKLFSLVAVGENCQVHATLDIAGRTVSDVEVQALAKEVGKIGGEVGRFERVYSTLSGKPIFSIYVRERSDITDVDDVDIWPEVGSFEYHAA